jgi:hypothetical protein
VVSFTYRLIFVPNGNVNGRGKYLANIMLVPLKVSVSWGYHFTAQMKIPTVWNSGTPTDPIAAAQLVLSMDVGTVVKRMHQSVPVLVRADGQTMTYSGEEEIPHLK